MKNTQRVYFAAKLPAVLRRAVTFSYKIQAAGKNPCKKDIAAFCNSVKPENRGIAKFLEQRKKTVPGMTETRK